MGFKLKNLFSCISLLCFFSLSFNTYSQIKKHSITGLIFDASSKHPISYARISIEELQAGTLSDEKGKFHLNKIPDGDYKLSVSFLGYANRIIDIKLRGDTTLYIKMREQSLKLSGINVMSSKRSRNSNGSIINKAALDYIQPTSIGDVLQLLPGQLSRDGTMTQVEQLSLRQSGHDNNTALGSAIVMNGMPMSNNANLQRVVGDQLLSRKNTVNKGVDLRLVSTDHLEKVEIIQGIASVKYGDLSSGIILTKAKSGKQPLEIRIKANPSNKLVYAGKGFELPGKWGALHTGIDYIEARPDERENLSSYKRYSLQMNYTNLLSLKDKPLQVEFLASHTGTLDVSKNDPNIIMKQESYKFRYNRTILSHRAMWQIASKWISSLEYRLALDQVKELTDRTLIVSPNGVLPLPTATTAGEYEGIYLPAEYITNYTMTGKPLSFFSQINGKSIFPFKSAMNILEWGAEYRYNKNNGIGYNYDILRPPFPASSRSSRPRRFNQIPAFQNLAFFMENRFSANIGEHHPKIITGIRFSTMPGINKRYQNLHNVYFVEPRVNAWWQFPTKKWFGKKMTFTLKGGYGEAMKMPTLDMLYPEMAYHDYISLNYYSQTPQNRLLWVTTNIIDRKNYNIEPNRNRKYELGFDFKLGKIKIETLFFREISNRGFQENINYYTQIFNTYHRPNDIIFNEKPRLSDFEQRSDSILDAYSTPENGVKLIKSGIEYAIKIPTIQSLSTSITINGAYYRTTYDISKPIMSSPYINLNGKPYKYVGIYAWDDGKIRSRFNTNVWINTHLPRYGLIFTTKIQALWYTSYQTSPFSGVPLYYFGVGKMERTPFKESDRNDPVLRFLVKNFSDKSFAPIIIPMQLSIDLKATKEISRNLRISFYVNRLFFYSPPYKTSLNTPMRIRTTPYFGTEIKITI